MNKKIYALSLSLCLLGMAMAPVQAHGAKLHKVSMSAYTPDQIAAVLSSFHELDDSFNEASQLAFNSGHYDQKLAANFNNVNEIRTASNFQPNIDANDVEPNSVVDYDDSDLSRLGELGAKDVFAQLRETGKHFNKVAKLDGAIADYDGKKITTDSTRLLNNIKWRIWAEKDFRDLERINFGEAQKQLAQVSNTDLTRLGTREVSTVAGVLDNVPLMDQIPNGIKQINGGAEINRKISTKLKSPAKIDAKLQDKMDNVYITHFNLADGSRDVAISPRIEGRNKGGLNMMVQEKGPGFDRVAYRISTPLENGLQKLTTYSLTNLANGNKVELGEERIVNLNGIGSGNGTLMIKQMDGNVVKSIAQEPLRTQLSPDGSMTTQLHRGNDHRVLVQADSNGAVQVSTAQEGDWSSFQPVIWTDARSALRELDR